MTGELLAGKRAMVTGGGGGIGSAIVTGLAQEGAHVAILGRSDSAESIAKRVSDNGGRAFPIQVDLIDRADSEVAFANAVDWLGGLDILVTSHARVRPSASDDIDISDWDLTLETNLTSVLRLSLLAHSKMRENGCGKIIHLLSAYVVLGGYRVASYAASKGGVAQLTKSLALEWAPEGINVNGVIPGYVRTNLNRHIWEDDDRSKEILSRIPANRWGEPEDIAGAVIFLASDYAKYVNGTFLAVDGGFLAR